MSSGDFGKFLKNFINKKLKPPNLPPRPPTTIIQQPPPNLPPRPPKPIIQQPPSTQNNSYSQSFKRVFREAGRFVRHSETAAKTRVNEASKKLQESKTQEQKESAEKGLALAQTQLKNIETYKNKINKIESEDYFIDQIRGLYKLYTNTKSKEEKEDIEIRIGRVLRKMKSSSNQRHDLIYAKKLLYRKGLKNVNKMFMESKPTNTRRSYGNNRSQRPSAPGGTTTGGTTGSISIGGAAPISVGAPQVSVSVPQAVQALPPTERSSLEQVGGFNSARRAIYNVGGPEKMENALRRLNSGRPVSNVELENLQRIGGQAHAKNVINAVERVTRKTRRTRKTATTRKTRKTRRTRARALVRKHVMSKPGTPEVHLLIKRLTKDNIKNILIKVIKSRR